MLSLLYLVGVMQAELLSRQVALGGKWAGDIVWEIISKEVEVKDLGTD